MGITVEATTLEGVRLVKPEKFGDARGFFLETYRQDTYRDAGIDYTFVQDNHSRSRQGVLRGIHLQDPTAPMAKLVRCSSGEVLDVAVDLRLGSPVFGHWVSAVLSEENGHQLLIPEGFGHGFLTLSDVADVEYKCSNFYAPDAEVAIAWNDPEVAIDWGPANPTLSDRDREGMSLTEYRGRPEGRRFTL